MRTRTEANRTPLRRCQAALHPATHWQTRAPRPQPPAPDPHVLLKIISNQKVTTSARVGSVGVNTFWFAARRNLGIRSWELHHENRREAFSCTSGWERLKSTISEDLRRVWCEVDWGRPNLGQYWGYFLDVILESEAEILSESRLFTARSDHIGFRGWFYRN